MKRTRCKDRSSGGTTTADVGPGKRRRPWLWPVLLLAVVAAQGIWLLPGLRSPRPVEPASAALSSEGTHDAVPFAITNGAMAAQIYCQSCHLFPDPTLLDRESWLNGAFRMMAVQLGVTQLDYSKRADGQILLEAERFPNSPILSEEHWQLVVDHYVSSAPDKPLPQPAHPEPQSGLPHFRVRPLPYGIGMSRICLLQVDETERVIRVMDGRTQSLDLLDMRGQVRRRYPLSGEAVQLIKRPEGYFLTMIGRLLPSDELAGSVGFYQPDHETYHPLLEGLRRPTDACLVDLNGDGREDIVVCQFGNWLGRLAWFKNLGEGRYEEKVLFDMPGSTQALVHDANQDGRPDIFALVGQSREGIYLFLNLGNDQFEQRDLVMHPPSYGYSHLELVDFNRDGHIDFLATNGDNGDYFSRPKAYHGIRLHLNDGQGQFAEAWFYPLYGAYKALPVDFDGDDDYDIAAISFFPDYPGSPEESFVYLQNQGGLNFAAYTFPESKDGRWLTMDAGDVDGDGDKDIALGCFLPGPTSIPVPQSFQQRWLTNSVSVMLLENTHRSPAPR